MNKIEVLIVEDREENRKAAKEYFDTRDDVNVDFATNYNEAIEKLEKNLYAAVILDIEFPKEEGYEPTKLGLELGKELFGKFKIPYLYLTGGYFHNEPKARIFLDNEDVECEVGKTVRDKQYADAWKNAFEILDQVPLEMIMMAKKRFQKTFGRTYTVGEQNLEAMVK